MGRHNKEEAVRISKNEENTLAGLGEKAEGEHNYYAHADNVVSWFLASQAVGPARRS